MIKLQDAITKGKRLLSKVSDIFKKPQSPELKTKSKDMMKFYRLGIYASLLILMGACEQPGRIQSSSNIDYAAEQLDTIPGLEKVNLNAKEIKETFESFQNSGQDYINMAPDDDNLSNDARLVDGNTICIDYFDREFEKWRDEVGDLGIGAHNYLYVLEGNMLIIYGGNMISDQDDLGSAFLMAKVDLETGYILHFILEHFGRSDYMIAHEDGTIEKDKYYTKGQAKGFVERRLKQLSKLKELIE